MKHLLNGAAIAAALAIAVPAWAQTQAPMTPSAPKAAAEAPSTYAPPVRHAYKQRHKRPARYAAKRPHKGYARGGSGGGDQMTDQLNREELSRIQGGGGGGPPMGAPPEGAGPQQGGPRPSGR
jgi:hypothetical protein